MHQRVDNLNQHLRIHYNPIKPRGAKEKDSRKKPSAPANPEAPAPEASPQASASSQPVPKKHRGRKLTNADDDVDEEEDDVDGDQDYRP